MLAFKRFYLILKYCHCSCRQLNPYIKKDGVKLEDLCVLSGILEPGDYGAVSDLDSGYWQVETWKVEKSLDLFRSGWPRRFRPC